MQLSDYLHFSSQRLPILLQSEVAECGVSCVAMVASYHGHKVNMITMRQRYPVGLRGVTVRQITQIANDLGMNARALKVDLGQLNKVKSPAILHWNFNHFVVLSKVTTKGIEIHDPAKGKCKLNWQEVSDAFTGICIELLPNADFEKQDERQRVPLRAFLGKVDGLWSSLAKIFVIALILQGLMLVSPYYIRLVVDKGVAADSTGLLWWFFLGFAFVLVLTTVTQIIRAGAIMYLDKSLGFQIKANIQKHLLHLPMGFFESRHVGDIKSRFEAFNEVQRLVSRGFITAVVDGLLSITTFCIMLSYDVGLALVSLAFLATLYGLRFILNVSENEYLEQWLSKQARENSHFIESVRAIAPIKAFAKEDVRLSSWLNLFADSTNASIRREKVQISTELSKQVLAKAEYLIIVLIGASLIIDSTITLGMFFAFLAYRQSFAESAQSLVDHLFKFRIAGTYFRRMSDIVLQEPEKDQAIAVLDPAQIQGNLTIQNLHFRYDNGAPWLFEGINFSIAAGESVAIVGKSGIGKTTLLKLITGLLRHTEGDILLDGTSLQRIGYRRFRSMCATVMQNDQLFNGSLIENITFFEPSPNMEKVREAAKGAAVWEDIEAMPMGLHSQVGDLGSAMSGGQKQRILLARALYSNPKILFLDEATSHLDIETEKQVNLYLKSRNITRISIAHREETIKAADRVIDLAYIKQHEAAVA